MALKKSEKQLVGVMLFIVAGASVFMMGMPNFAGLQQAWAKKTELETNLKNLATTETSLQAEIASLKQQMQLPNDITLRKHTPENLQANVKSILDKVLDMAAMDNNTIISLAPWKDVPPILPPPPAPPQGTAAPAAANAAAPAAGTTPADPNAPPPPPPPPPLTVVGYDLAIRGTFGSVQAFLKDMDKQKELVEISNIQIVNEHGPDRGAAADQDASSQTEQKNSPGPLLDPDRPIKLFMKLRLVLEPASGIDISGVAPTPAATAKP